MLVKENKTTNNEYIKNSSTNEFKNLMSKISKNYLYERGLFATLINNSITNEEINNIDKLLKNNVIINNDSIDAIKEKLKTKK